MVNKMLRKDSNLQSLGEEISNAISHGLMACFGIVGMILLFIKSNTCYIWDRNY